MTCNCSRVGMVVLTLLAVASHYALAACPNITFTDQPRSRIVNGTAKFLLAGDVNNDGKVDLIVPITPSEVKVAFGNGTGVFSFAPTSILAPAECARLADFNRDGNLDLVIGGANSIRCYSGNGTGAFQLRLLLNLSLTGGGVIDLPVSGTPLPPKVVGLAVADFDNDRRMDFGFVQEQNPAIEIRLPTTDDFQFRTELLVADRFALEASANLHSLEVGDFNHDGAPDLITADPSNDAVYVFNRKPFVVNGSPLFDFGRKFPGVPGARNIVVADFDRDGFDDAAITTSNSQIQFFRGLSTVIPPIASWKTMTLPESANVAAAGDFDSDGNVDLIVGYPSGGVDLFINDGAGNFTSKRVVTLLGSANALAVADFDRNGTDDFAVVHSSDRAVIFLNQCPAASDLAISAIEVVQTIQDLGNSVPLISGKRTFARVHVASGGPLRGLSAELQGFDEVGSPLTPNKLIPSNANVVVDVPSQPDREQLDDSFYFEIPEDWTRKRTISLRATVDTRNQLNDPDRSNNVRSTGPLLFSRTKTLHVHVFELDAPGITYGPSGDPDVEKKWDDDFEYIAHALKVKMPFSQVELTRERITTDKDLGTTGTSPALAFFMINLAATSSQPRGTLFFGNSDMFRGAADSDPFTMPHIASWGSGQRTAVHEIGHLLTLSHAPGCDAPSPDPMFPYPDGLIGGPATDPKHFAGVMDYAGDFRVIGSKTHDLMTYCPDVFLFSDYHLAKMSSYFSGSSYFTSGGTRRHQNAFTVGETIPVIWVPAAVGFGEPIPVWKVTGAFSTDGGIHDVQLDLQPTVEAPKRSLQRGDLQLSLISATGEKVASTLVPSGGTFDAPATRTFHGLLPRDPRGRSVVVADRRGNVLQTRKISPNPPDIDNVEVEIIDSTNPRSTNVRIKWRATDKDGDPLHFDVLYSRDGEKTWRLVGRSISASSIVIPISQLPGTRRKPVGVFKVVANDGANLSIGKSSPREFPNQPPRVMILSPRKKGPKPPRIQATYHAGQLVTIEVLALDVEDGPLKGKQITWRYPRGKKKEFAHGDVLQRTNFPVGEQIVDVDVRDSEGARSHEELRFQIDR